MDHAEQRVKKVGHHLPQAAYFSFFIGKIVRKNSQFREVDHITIIYCREKYLRVSSNSPTRATLLATDHSTNIALVNSSLYPLVQ